MSKIIAEMRKVQQFIPYDKWDNTISTNCIAFALGLPIDDPKREIFREILTGSPIKKLEKLLNDLGLEHRRISSATEIKSDEYGIVLYHYSYQQVQNSFGVRWTETQEEVHLARIEDGTWVHKFGWDYDTSTTTPQEIHDIILEEDEVDVEPTAFFAVKKPQ